MVQLTIATNGERVDAATPEMTGGVRSLLTVMVTAPEMAVLPAASRATAVSVWAPLAAVVVSHESA